jgi:hypothetical protein
MIVEGDKYCKELKYDEAAKSYRKAADLGCAVAMASLGDLYFYYHDGIRQDVKEAVKWYRMAADKGNKYSMEVLEKIKLGEKI